MVIWWFDYNNSAHNLVCLDHKDTLTDYTRSKHALRGTKETRDFDYNNPPHNLLCLGHKYYFNLLYWIQTRPKLGTQKQEDFD